MHGGPQFRRRRVVLYTPPKFRETCAGLVVIQLRERPRKNERDTPFATFWRLAGVSGLVLPYTDQLQSKRHPQAPLRLILEVNSSDTALL